MKVITKFICNNRGLVVKNTQNITGNEAFSKIMIFRYYLKDKIGQRRN